jgi:hypothetical protein
VVLTSPGAPPGELFAAQELAHQLGNISNFHTALPVHNTSDAPPGTIKIAVGYAASIALGVRPADLEGLGLEGFRISVAGAHNRLPKGCFAVSGGKFPGGKRGAMYGVYEMLLQLGLDFIAWDETVYPAESPNADLHALLDESFTSDVVQQPSFVYRDLGEWPVYSNRLHGRRMRLNNNEHLECVEDVGNRDCKGLNTWDQFHFADPPGMAHSIYKLLCSNGTSDNPNGHCDDPLKPPQDLIKTHPEWCE